MNDNLTDIELYDRIRRNDRSAFSVLFIKYYNDLLVYCISFIGEREGSEDILQNVFLKLWQERETVNIGKSIRSYLLKAVRNDCLDRIRHCKTVTAYKKFVCESIPAMNWDFDHYIMASELEKTLAEGLTKLDLKSREAFCMNRYEKLKYREIALKLGVSERTVEVRISKALSFLKDYIKKNGQW